MATVTIPRRFYDDHVYRDNWGGRVVKETRQTYTVDFEQEDLDNFISDARFYAAMGQGEFDRCYAGVVKSAVATVKSLSRQGVTA